MKRILILLLLLPALLVRGQGHLQITGLSGFPASPSDSAFESRVYDSINVTVQNIGTDTISDFISIFAQAGPATTDTIYSDSATASFFQPGSSIIYTRNGYRFSPLNYDDGDNIVVVWPAARFTNVIADTLHLHVYFISLIQATAGVNEKPFIVAPNPATDYIFLGSAPLNNVQQVRIYDMTGRLVLTLPENQTFIPVSGWQAGMYMINVTMMNGSRRYIRMEKI